MQLGINGARIVPAKDACDAAAAGESFPRGEIIEKLMTRVMQPGDTIAFAFVNSRDDNHDPNEPFAAAEGCEFVFRAVTRWGVMEMLREKEVNEMMDE